MVKVGLIEDCPVTRHLLSEMVKTNNWEPLTFADAESARKCTDKLDVLLVDMDKTVGANHMAELKNIPQVEGGLVIVPFFGRPKTRRHIREIFTHTDESHTSLLSSIKNVLDANNRER